MIALGFVGTASGWIVNAIHGGDFLRGTVAIRMPGSVISFPEDWGTRPIDRIWIASVAGHHYRPFVAFQVDVDAMLGNRLVAAPATLLGVIGGTLAVVMRFAPRRQRGPRLQSPMGASLVRRTVEDTNFITVWVIGAFLYLNCRSTALALTCRRCLTAGRAHR